MLMHVTQGQTATATGGIHVERLVSGADFSNASDRKRKGAARAGPPSVLMSTGSLTVLNWMLASPGIRRRLSACQGSCPTRPGHARRLLFIVETRVIDQAQGFSVAQAREIAVQVLHAG